MLILIALMLVGLGIAIRAATGPTGMLAGLGLESPWRGADANVFSLNRGSIVRGPIEVSGIRGYIGEDSLPHLRAYVANRSDKPQAVSLRVLLRMRRAGALGVPLAGSEIVVSDAMPPHSSQGIALSLAEMVDGRTFPAWDKVRVDIEPQVGASR